MAKTENQETFVAPVVNDPSTATVDVPEIPDATEPIEPDTSVHLKDIEGVRYIGKADARILTVGDLASVGVEAKGRLSFDRAGDFWVPKSEINADTLHWLAAQPDFRAE